MQNSGRILMWRGYLCGGQDNALKNLRSPREVGYCTQSEGSVGTVTRAVILEDLIMNIFCRLKQRGPRLQAHHPPRILSLECSSRRNLTFFPYHRTPGQILLLESHNNQHLGLLKEIIYPGSCRWPFRLAFCPFPPSSFLYFPLW